MNKNGLYYREFTLTICEDIDGVLDIIIEEPNAKDGSSKMSNAISDEDYKNILSLVHNFDKRFRELKEQKTREEFGM